jgi:MFS family permease
MDPKGFSIGGSRAEPWPAPTVVGALGFAQIIAWGSSYYLPAVLAPAIAAHEHWPLPWVVGGLSLGLVAAGLVSPRVGRLIEQYGGRPVLAASAVLLALGLSLLAIAPTLPLHVAAWLVVGLGMGAGLYDAAFATLGRAYGESARGRISALTLIAGFANTIAWPLSGLMLSRLGWRSTCLGWATLDLLVLLPLYLLVMPREATRGLECPPLVQAPVPDHAGRSLFALLAITNTLGQAISAVFSVHLLTLLVARGLAPALAVAWGAALGPAQVSARAIEVLTGKRHHPVWTMQAWTGLVAVGIALMWMWPAALPVALVCYGGGVGIGSIARGAVPLALFGPGGYAVRMGRLALPNLLAQAAAPMLVAVLLERIGASNTLAVLAGAALLDMLLTIAVVAAALDRRYAAAR